MNKQFEYKLNEIEKVFKAELAAIREEMKAEKLWPQVGDEYWLLGDTGTLWRNAWCGDVSDFARQSIGNIFRTKAEAQAELAARKVIAELRACDGWTAFEVDGRNWGIAVPFKRGCVFVQWSDVIEGCWQSIYFKDEESAKAAIEKVGEQRILKASRWLAMREAPK